MPPALASRYIASVKAGQVVTRKSYLIEGLHATIVLGFVSVNDSDERPGIGEGHRLA
jgi:hypothetical protein